MAGMFYSLDEAAGKLNTTAQRVQELAREGKLREFRDGSHILFKVSEVEALTPAEVDKKVEETTQPAAPPQPAAQEEPQEQPRPAGGVEPELRPEPEPTVEPKTQPPAETKFQLADEQADRAFEAELEQALSESQSAEQRPPQARDAREAEPELSLEPAPEAKPEPAAEHKGEPAAEGEPEEPEQQTPESKLERPEQKKPEPAAQAKPQPEPEAELQPTGDKKPERTDAEDTLPELSLEPDEELADTNEILLAPDGTQTKGSEAGLSSAETAISGDTTVKKPGREKTDQTLSDTLADTQRISEEATLEEIEEDVNLDTLGSGSGLLDLSLQADDTSLGGILDEIYTTEGPEEPASAEASQAVAAEADQMISEELAAPQPAQMALQAYIEPEPDSTSNTLGIMLFLPLLAVIYTATVVAAAFRNFAPSIMASVQDLIWFIVIGGVVIAGIFVAAALLGGRSAGPKKQKKKKAAAKAKVAGGQ